MMNENANNGSDLEDSGMILTPKGPLGRMDADDCENVSANDAPDSATDRRNGMDARLQTTQQKKSRRWLTVLCANLLVAFVASLVFVAIHLLLYKTIGLRFYVCSAISMSVVAIVLILLSMRKTNKVKYLIAQPLVLAYLALGLYVGYNHLRNPLIFSLAHLGYPQAQVIVGEEWHYLKRGATEADYAKAFEWISLAAKQDDNHAKLLLAEFYWRGVGCEKNHQKTIAILEEIVKDNKNDIWTYPKELLDEANFIGHIIDWE